MPSLQSHNRFACLEVDEINDTSELVKSVVPESDKEQRRLKRRGWERRLPRSMVLAATPSSKSLRLQVELQTTDTQDMKVAKALLDSGASGLFANQKYIDREQLNTRKLSEPIIVHNVDGTPNEAGPIKEVLDIVLQYNGHSERTTFAVTEIGDQDLILGLPWLREHNPEVDWETGEVKMSRCPSKCQTCRDEVREERRIRRTVDQKFQRCREGPTPEVDIEMEDLPELGPDSDDGEDETEEDEEEVEVGDRIFAIGLEGDSEEIRATSNISQRLAEAYHRNEAPKDFRDDIPNYLSEFEGVFAKESFDALPERKPWDHAIELVPDAELGNCKIYPLSRDEQSELDAFLEESLASGRIRPSKSPMAAPCFFIKKKNGKLRLVQDYRKLNNITVKNRYPLPLIPELIGKLRGAKYFTKLDVRWGYHNVQIREGDEWKAAFRTNRGLFEPLVMLFGLTNSPATFQTMMNDIFQDLISEGVVCVYIDDILIFTKTLEEHQEVLWKVMEKLRHHKLFLQLEKCEFERTRIEYLGLIISENTVEMDPVKVKGVKEWPVPGSKKEVQQFLGFVNFYRRFIPGFSHYARPLFDLTGDGRWRWGKEQQEAFEELRDRITSAPILRQADDEKPFRVEADSSDFATGAVLSQQADSDDKWHPVAFLSKSLNAVERNYEIHDKEMLAIIRALEEWRHFLEGAQHKVEIWTDHRNLQYFMTARKLNRRQARWSLYLSRFDFTLLHKPGKSMGKSDALSRRPDHGDGSGDNADITLLKPELFAIRTLGGLCGEGEEKDILREIRRQSKGEEQLDPVVVAAEALKRGSGRSVQSAEWRMEDGVVLFRDWIYVPKDVEL